MKYLEKKFATSEFDPSPAPTRKNSGLPSGIAGILRFSSVSFPSGYLVFFWLFFLSFKSLNLPSLNKSKVSSVPIIELSLNQLNFKTVLRKSSKELHLPNLDVLFPVDHFSDSFVVNILDSKVFSLCPFAGLKKLLQNHLQQDLKEVGKGKITLEALEKADGPSNVQFGSLEVPIVSPSGSNLGNCALRYTFYP